MKETIQWVNTATSRDSDQKYWESRVFMRIEEKQLLTAVSVRLYDKTKFNKPKCKIIMRNYWESHLQKSKADEASGQVSNSIKILRTHPIPLSQSLLFPVFLLAHYFPTHSSLPTISLCQCLINQTVKLIQLHVLVKHKTSHDPNIKEQGWDLTWLYFSWTSSFTQLAARAHQCSQLDSTCRSEKHDQTEPHQVSHCGLSPIPHLPPPKSADSWFCLLRKTKPSSTPFGQFWQLQEIWIGPIFILGPNPEVYPRHLEVTDSNTSSLSGAYPLGKCMTGWSCTALIDLPALTLRPLRRK